MVVPPLYNKCQIIRSQICSDLLLDPEGATRVSILLYLLS